MIEYLKDIWAGLRALFRFAIWVVPWCILGALIEIIAPGSFPWIGLVLFVLYLLQQLGSISRGKT